MHDTKMRVLLGWLERRWSLVPLHDVASGTCSCNLGAQCRSAGKHPRYTGWQHADQLVRDPIALGAVVAAHPGWNWGVATGAASGMWVLDVDGESGADALADLCFAHGAQTGNIGMWMNTLQLGPTGGGGYHFVFALPDFEVRGSQTRNRYGLPPGLDVRGHHGQIVVAPSVSGKGPYGGVLLDAPVRRAPGWLEEMLRPQVVDRPVDSDRTIPDSPAQGLDPRGAAYAASAVGAELASLAQAPVGTRNDAAYRVACRLIEIGNAPWCPWNLEMLESSWWQAASAHPDGAYVPDGELTGVWRRAAARVGEAAAVLPTRVLGAEHVPILGEMPGFPVPGVGAGLPGGADGVVGGVDPVQALIDRMLTPEQIRLLPKPEPLVQGLLDLRTTAWLIGRPKSGKSFVALDLAAHVGLGLAWQHRPVRQGCVVYIVAEGSQGIGLRLDAWEREYGPMKDLLVLPEPVQASERAGRFGPDVAGGWTVLVEACRRLRPALVVIDTQARVTAGLNENDNGDMSYYASQADRIKEASGACVLTVHHIGRSGSNARGASAIDGAQDAELRIERPSDDSMMIALHVDAQKDMAAEKPLTIGLKRSEGGMSPEGRDLSSLVLVRPAESGELAFQDPAVEVMPRWRLRMIALYQLILDRYNAGAGGTESEIKVAFKALPEIAALSSADSRDKAWARAWNGTDSAPGLVPRGLIAQKAGAARFKIVVIEDQSTEGALTPNDLSKNTTVPPEGWNLYLPDQSPR